MALGAMTVAVTLATLGLAMAMAPPQQPPQGGGPTAKTKAKADPARPGDRKTRKGGLLAGGAVPPEKGAEARPGDPLTKAAAAPAAAQAAPPRWPFHYKFKLVGPSGAGLQARFYPARGGATAPVILLIHGGGTGHSGQDFEEPVEGLKGKSFAEHLQGLDYAVLVVDRRGLGGTAPARAQVVRTEPAALLTDLQTAYSFLIDRHNRRELNLAKMGAVALGDGANLAVAWAAMPGAAVSSPGRLTDLGGLVLVSPQLEAFDSRLLTPLASIAPRLPIALLAGTRDAEAFDAARPLVERNRGSQAVQLESRLQADRLLRFDPKIAEMITDFLEDPVKFRTNSEWEPRYLLNPVAAADVTLVPHEAPGAGAGNAAAAAPAPGEPGKNAAEPTSRQEIEAAKAKAKAQAEPVPAPAPEKAKAEPARKGEAPPGA
jgi:pimeloyl-ACP methyl ester carboxylesterase